ncbi:LacI family DNA-binding transcriptional regulator [Paenibacillus cremeus]|uniref:LacI family transcriptional regulator n=1 Tax=Paenibacillus cremeus TaxID=2163881 RepID=A0A559K634_9BACL|nr:LacI family DNA-binding transcriptional regulator [Paenibacillus cremeus]TVY07595.1 LacI family transcriptional regulator [Paenibacillus cremeus]
MAHKVSMQQIADSLGVSKYTVSRSLAGKSGVSLETRARVLEVARTMGYRSRAPIDEITPIMKPIDGLGDPPYVLIWIRADHRSEGLFWGKVLSGMLEGCKRQGWNHVIMAVESGETVAEGIPAYLDPAHCVGHLIAGELPSALLLTLSRKGLPMVLVDHEESALSVDCIVNANMQGGRWLTARMLQAGCTSLLFVGHDAFSVSFKERWFGCKLEMQEAGKRAEVALRKWSIPYGARNWQAVLERKLEQLTEKEWPHAILGANDDIALHCLSILDKLSMAVPAQCKVAGFDNIETAALSRPALTTVDFGKEFLGYRAVEQLRRRMEHPGQLTEKITISARIVCRVSG